jgi:hypothetical protein
MIAGSFLGQKKIGRHPFRSTIRRPWSAVLSNLSRFGLRNSSTSAVPPCLRGFLSGPRRPNFSGSAVPACQKVFSRLRVVTALLAVLLLWIAAVVVPSRGRSSPHLSRLLCHPLHRHRRARPSSVRALLYRLGPRRGSRRVHPAPSVAGRPCLARRLPLEPRAAALPAPRPYRVLFRPFGAQQRRQLREEACSLAALALDSFPHQDRDRLCHFSRRPGRAPGAVHRVPSPRVGPRQRRRQQRVLPFRYREPQFSAALALSLASRNEAAERAPCRTLERARRGRKEVRRVVTVTVSDCDSEPTARLLATYIRFFTATHCHMPERAKDV